MHPILILINLAAAVMLLLYAVRMVRTGIERAHGAALRDRLQGAAGSRIGAAAAGGVLAMLLQSATAVGVLAAGFAASGVIGVATGLAALLGADLGSALVVRLLALDLKALVPVLILTGCVLFLKIETRRAKQYGRIILGIGFVLLSLQMISQATEPLRDSAALPVAMEYLGRDPLTAFVLAMLLAWAVHSSVAMVLLLAALAQSGALPMAAALPMLLGANTGGALIAVWLTRGMVPVARRIPLGNLLLRGAAALALLAVVAVTGVELPAWLGQGEAVRIVNGHLLFNAVVVIFALPLIAPAITLAALVAPVLPEPIQPGQRRKSALDRATLALPQLALASAKRELLLMGAALEEMLRPAPEMLRTPTPEIIATATMLDDEMNRRHADIKLFLAALGEGGLDPAEARESLQLTGLAINLEHAGDIVAKTLAPLAQKKVASGRQFSQVGMEELLAMHTRVMVNLQLAMNVLISGDPDAARRLMREKEVMRALERDSHQAHLARLSAGNPESLATSHWHLEALRALKEINSLLVSVAVPILEERGEVLRSRLAPGQ
ncbi:Na/Pi cotransporter family protein [Pararhodobacter zhoushanensis]|uniref:Na/Pi cotransporter family protein n=1 Tax=Pararhodobacter zhoushanensis TaxID=2479545 RepID=A0ABT3GVU2_9RHOB|nr:Na/Pi cotransporter family protein [Pararhodobacter zhoushanensis]MCW1931657.1 Na/Pi cotransporter family protein [Pararhodobacter zhoushanensis]